MGRSADESRIQNSVLSSKPNSERRLLQGKTLEELTGTVANLACPVLHIRCCPCIQRKVASPYAGLVSSVAALGRLMWVMPNPYQSMVAMRSARAHRIASRYCPKRSDGK